MEVIRFAGYTVEEKVAIHAAISGRGNVERNGLLTDEVDVHGRPRWELVVTDYTR